LPLSSHACASGVMISSTNFLMTRKSVSYQVAGAIPHDHYLPMSHKCSSNRTCDPLRRTLTLLQRPVTLLVVRALELRSEPGRLSVGHFGNRPGLRGDDPRFLALDLADTQAGVLRFLQDLGAVSERSAV
jgi:hypothetical protein